MKALIIEDDPEIVESVSLAFHMGWPEARLISTHLGQQGLEMVESENPQIVILDLGLPDVDGFDVLKQTRSFSSVPIIILTAKTDESNIVKGLERGADDFIVKPCGQLELLARIKARVRNSNNHHDESPVSFGTLHFDPPTHQLLKGKTEIKLTAIESHIIYHLMRNGNRVSTYSRIAEDVWGDDYPGSVDSLRVHIRRLREKIEEDPSHPRLIHTKSGIGYFMANPQ